MRYSRVIVPILAASLFGSPVARSFAAPPGRQADIGKQDLADVAAGIYSGDVVSDARGSSQSNVRITVTKIGPNKVQISSDYSRLPTFAATLTRAMHTIQNRTGDEVFLLDLSQTPASLQITVDDASWAGVRK
jgi:hypothetical protein